MYETGFVSVVLGQACHAQKAKVWFILFFLFEVIIDWHDHNAEDHEAEAAEFFREMAMEYGEFPNVIFEIYNEPIKQSWSQTIKPYHERIVSVIREYSSNLIVLGTKTWSQDVDEAAQNPVQGENLAYTIHFYANTHKQDFLILPAIAFVYIYIYL